ncbi:flagellar FlbD family protein [Nocardioides sp. Kera G14]|uniref:flagellar FlbD family protein n=1 Tax=Nocardioides sp. Kera G14 TaxID=2884264 RepID=UPI001D12AE60|nr:flagellar FlbD family protein [Nocardioides sp. Kera G14]UDY24061.1 flagellar FlbD family protein [Nocardioides sp. Kera G14]
MMITLTRLSGSQFLLNADLIERVDSTPDTVITLVDGKKYVVSESIGDVLDAVVAYRGEIVALGSLLDAAHAHAQSMKHGAPAPRRGEPKLASVASHPSALHVHGVERTGGDA